MFLLNYHVSATRGQCCFMSQHLNAALSDRKTKVLTAAFLQEWSHVSFWCVHCEFFQKGHVKSCNIWSTFMKIMTSGLSLTFYRDEPTASLIESSGFCASAVCLWVVEDVVWLRDITAEYFPLADLNNSELITELFLIWILDVCTSDSVLNECYILQVSVVFLESSILEGRKCSACQHNTG